MKRSDLYRLVWETPVTKLAKELGVSDVGLAKACRRHSIPLPARGHWAKVAAGHEVRRAALPVLKDDPEIVLKPATKDPNALTQPERAASPASPPAAALPERIERPHPLLKVSMDFFAELPRSIAKSRGVRLGDAPDFSLIDMGGRFGRHNSLYSEGLDILVSVNDCLWALRFCHALLQALLSAGFVVRGVKEPGQWGRHSVEVRKDGEAMTFSLVQGYSRQLLVGEELAKRKAVMSWASARIDRPVDRYTFRLDGAVSYMRTEWKGKAAELEAKLPQIVAAFEALPGRQRDERERRREEQAASERRRAEAERQHRIQMAPRAEYERATKVAEQYDEWLRTQELLKAVRAHASSLAPQQADILKTWLGVVESRAENVNPIRSLVAAIVGTCERGQLPIWWPSSPPTPAGREAENS